MTDQEIRLKFGELNASEMRQPIMADDGRSLDEVYIQAYNDALGDRSAYEASEIALRAVAAVVLAQAVRRMKAVPVEELEKAYWDGNEAVANHTALKRVCARLIAAAKGEGQAQEVPQVEVKPDPEEPAWIPHDGGPCPLKDEEVEEWQVKMRNYEGYESISLYKNLPPSQASGWRKSIISYRVLKWKPGFVPEAKAEQDPYARLKAAHAAGKIIQMKLKNEPDDTWDDIPDPGWGLDPDEYRIKPEPAQSTTSIGWTPAVGDTVRLKSGGPVMTVTGVDPKSLMCAWMNASNELQVEPITTLCLEPAQP